MTSEKKPLFVLCPDATADRLAGVERHAIEAGGALRQLCVALPKSYEASRRGRYPLLFVLDAEGLFGSAVEMSRLMSDTSENRECIVVGLPGLGGDGSAEAAGRLAAMIGGEILAWCRERYRIEEGEVALYGCNAAAVVVLQALLGGVEGISRFIAGEHDLARASAVLRRFRELPVKPGVGRKLSLTATGRAGELDWQEFGKAVSKAAGGAAVSVRWQAGLGASTLAMPALLDGLRSLWGTSKNYGDNVIPMSKRAVSGLLELASPLFRRLRRRPLTAFDPANRQLLRAENMARNFEIFVSLPASYAPASLRRYPALLVLDANIEFSTVAEATARMAAAGEIAETLVIGIGTPRSEGPMEFAFRRFEEFSPPAPRGYAYGDDLGCVFRSLFAVRGQDARRRLGRAPEFFRFIVDDLLPLLQRQLPVDAGDLGLLGHSAGGTFVGYTLYRPDSPFRRYFAVSPGVGISDSWLLNHAQRGDMAPRAEVAVLTLGSLERGNAFNRMAGIDRTEEWGQRLREQRPALDLRCECLEGETHSSVYPRAVALSLRAGYAVANPVAIPVSDSAIGHPVAA